MPELFPLKQLRRAPENVRHTRIDEDVAELADDILAHGLLQSLIGYRDGDVVQIVGGGRRFQALRRIEDEAGIDGDFCIPVLIRDRDEAIELSLAENLQQRTMSPVDEFFAFRALIDTGRFDPAELAKRFGFTERVVKQRLRLAGLAPEILDALANRAITLDVAMAYARSQDQGLQSLVFKAEKKRSHDPHRITNIHWAMSTKGIRTDNPVFKFVGAESYERRGGLYEDDLFNANAGDVRDLATPAIALTAAQEMLDFQMVRVLAEARKNEKFAPTIVGYVTPANLRLESWGTQEKLDAPAGFAKAEKHEHSRMWKTIRNNGIDVHVLAGINPKGELVIHPSVVFVPKAQKEAVAPSQGGYSHTPMSAEEQAAARRDRGVDRLQKRLAVGPFAGTAFEGRAYWIDAYNREPTPKTIDGKPGWLVPVDIFVTEEQIAAHRDEAEREYDRTEAVRVATEQAERDAEAAEIARRQAIRSMDPPAAVMVVDGQAFIRKDDGSYESEDQLEAFADLDQLIRAADRAGDELGDAFASIELFQAAMAAAGGEA
jgi:ParB/RepB/Spo0J family partition protein